jgi:lipoate-protein ligase A
MIGTSSGSVQPASAARGPGAGWDLVLAWARTCARQMAVDQALAESVWAGRRPPTLRIYGWHAPGLTIGRLQRPGALPAPAVRRWTGGRAVFHQHEVTVSLALPAGHPLIAPSVPATYRNVTAPILAALAALGLPAEVPGPRPIPGATRDRERFACFSGPTAAEPEIGGRKVAAVAQRIGPEGLLVQASIPLKSPTAFGPGAAARVAGLTRYRPGLAWDDVAGALAAAFSTASGGPLNRSPLRRAEQRRAAALAAGPYAPHDPSRTP